MVLHLDKIPPNSYVFRHTQSYTSPLMWHTLTYYKSTNKSTMLQQNGNAMAERSNNQQNAVIVHTANHDKLYKAVYNHYFAHRIQNVPQIQPLLILHRYKQVIFPRLHKCRLTPLSLPSMTAKPTVHIRLLPNQVQKIIGIYPT